MPKLNERSHCLRSNWIPIVHCRVSISRNPEPSQKKVCRLSTLFVWMKQFLLIKNVTSIIVNMIQSVFPACYVRYLIVT